MTQTLSELLLLIRLCGEFFFGLQSFSMSGITLILSIASCVNLCYTGIIQNENGGHACFSDAFTMMERLCRH
jgi:hypothetical protein